MERSTHLARHMKSKTLFLMFLLILCFLMSPVSSGQARAQDQTFGHDLPAQPLTLEGAIAYGLAYNQTLQSAGKDIEAAKQNVKQAQAGFLPKLDTGYSFSSWTFDPIAKFENVRFQTNENPLNLWQVRKRPCKSSIRRCSGRPPCWLSTTPSGCSPGSPHCWFRSLC